MYWDKTILSDARLHLNRGMHKRAKWIAEQLAANILER